MGAHSQHATVQRTLLICSRGNFRFEMDFEKVIEAVGAIFFQR